MSLVDEMEALNRRMQKTVLNVALMGITNFNPNTPANQDMRNALRGAYGVSPDRDMSEGADPTVAEMSRQIVMDAVFRQGLFSGLS